MRDKPTGTGARPTRTPSRPSKATGIEVEDTGGGNLPRYLQVAAHLREEITSGRLAPGTQVPSESQLMLGHRVSRSVAKRAISVLKDDHLVRGRQGSGVYVTLPSRVIREPGWPAPLTRPGDGSERYWPAALPGAWRIDPWAYQSDQLKADAVVAHRLAIGRGQPVYRTISRYIDRDDRTQLLLVTSWQPATSTPDTGPTILDVDEACERIIVRAATLTEITGLELPSRGLVMAITRTQTAHDVPVEIADIVMSAERCELVYRVPITDPTVERRSR